MHFIWRLLYPTFNVNLNIQKKTATYFMEWKNLELDMIVQS